MREVFTNSLIHKRKILDILHEKLVKLDFMLCCSYGYRISIKSEIQPKTSTVLKLYNL